MKKKVAAVDCCLFKYVSSTPIGLSGHTAARILTQLNEFTILTHLGSLLPVGFNGIGEHFIATRENSSTLLRKQPANNIHRQLALQLRVNLRTAKVLLMGVQFAQLFNRLRHEYFIFRGLPRRVAPLSGF